MTEAYISPPCAHPRGKGRKDGCPARAHARLRLSALTASTPSSVTTLKAHAVDRRDLGQRDQVMERKEGGCPGASWPFWQSDLDERIPGLAIQPVSCASAWKPLNAGANQIKGGAGNGLISPGGRKEDEWPALAMGKRRGSDCPSNPSPRDGTVICAQGHLG